jgi:hypothetical protein
MIGITRKDTMRPVNSQFITVWQRGSYIVRSSRRSIIVAMGFHIWVDALVLLEEDAKQLESVLPPLEKLAK